LLPFAKKQVTWRNRGYLSFFCLQVEAEESPGRKKNMPAVSEYERVRQIHLSIISRSVELDAATFKHRSARF